MPTTELNTTQLGKTGLEISRVGFGAWAIGGGGWEFGWGPQGDDQSIAAIQHALERIARMPDDDWRKHDSRFLEPELSRNLEVVDRLAEVAERHDTVPGAVAISWTLRNHAVDGAIVGFRSPEQVDPLIEAANLELSQEDIATIEGDR